MLALVSRSLSLLLVMTLAACAPVTTPFPDGSVGPHASIVDSQVSRGNFGADMFYLEKYNGAPVADSLTATAEANAGRGFAMSPVVLGRNIPATPGVFSLKGRSHYAAPIIELSNTVFSFTGDVRFTPENGKKYVVKGTLSREYSALWIEDADTGTQVGTKLETKSDTSLSFFEK